MMNQSPRVFQFFSALILVSGVTCCRTGESARNPWLAWSRVHLEVDALPLASGEVVLRRSSEEGKTRLQSTSTARLLGATVAESRTLSVIDGTTGRPERFESVSSRSASRYRFGEHEYRVEKLTPAEDPSRPLGEWNVESERVFPYPRDEHGRPLPVYDYYAMLLHLRELDLRRVGDEAQTFVATSDGAVGFRIVVAESRRATRSLADPARQTPKTLELTELRLRIVPTDPERASEGFLKMEGETALWVERDSKTVVEIDGRLPRVPGEVRLVLTEMD